MYECFVRVRVHDLIRFLLQLALTDVGLLYSWGNGSDGALGHGDTNACLEPRLVSPDSSFKNGALSSYPSSGGILRRK